MNKPPQSHGPPEGASPDVGAIESTSAGPANARRVVSNANPRSVPVSIGPRPVATRSPSTTTSGSLTTVTDRHLPVLLSTLRGELELSAVRHHDEQVAAIIANSLDQKRPVVYVVDARGVAMPSAMVRRYWATQINQSRAVLDSMLGTFIVLDNAVVRGALTAIVWMTDAAQRLSYVPTFEVALERANALLTAQGHAPVSISVSQRSLLPRR